MIDAFTSLKYELSKVKNDMGSEVKQLKEECEDHLQAINENTEELANIQNSLELNDQKIEKLNSRIDNIHMMFNQLLWQTKIRIDLDTQEQMLFQILCSYNDFLTSEFVAEKIQLPDAVMRAVIGEE